MSYIGIRKSDKAVLYNQSTSKNPGEEDYFYELKRDFEFNPPFCHIKWIYDSEVEEFYCTNIEMNYGYGGGL